MKLKVKFFEERELNELETKINEFIQSDECKIVVNIQYGTDGTMVVYSDQEPEEPKIIINNESTSKEGE